MTLSPQMMRERDTLQRFVFEDSAVRGNLVHLDDTLKDALSSQEIPHGLKCALGELMAASCLLAATLKMQGSLILQLQSKGALKLLVVECTSEFKLRATAKWTGEITDAQNLFDVIENGQCMITLDPKDGNQPYQGQVYQGIVPLEGASISAILENYMLRSEQIDTHIWLTSDGETASGMLIQRLPDAVNQAEITQEKTEENLETWQRVGHLASTVTSKELSELSTETLLTRLFFEENIRLFEASDTTFFCSCSRDNVANMLKILGPVEIRNIIAERGEIEVDCDFCNARYAFDPVDAEALLLSNASVDANIKIH